MSRDKLVLTPPYDEKSEKIAQKLFKRVQKKRPDVLNATQKTRALYKLWFLKKIRKTFKKMPF